MKKSMTASFSPSSPSMAYKCKFSTIKDGISTKENNPLGSMGMNPNLNIEDEYIENLLKQIHFMNMQIKLIKQKQSQSDGNALWGIVNRTNMPMVNNIVQSSKKYQEMKKDVDANLHRLQKDIASLQNHQGALINQIKFLDRKKTEILQKSKKWSQECKLKHQMLDQKIKNNNSKLKTLREQLQKQRKKNKQLIEQSNKSINDDKMDRSKQQKQSLQIKNDQIIQQTVLNQIVGQISVVQLLTNNLIEKFQKNPDYIKAKQDDIALREQVTKLQRNIVGVNFEIIQLNESIKMAEIEKDNQIRERKKLTEEYEEKKGMFSQIILMNSLRKQKQIQNRKTMSQDILKAEQHTAKLQKILQQTKKKLLKNQQTNVVVSNEVQTYQSDIEKLKETQKKLKQQLQKQKKQNQQFQLQLVGIQNQLIIKTDQYQKSLNTETHVTLQLFEMERQLQYLRERRQLLIKNINLKDAIDSLKIQDLEKVVQKNNDLNSTVATLMNKWDQIKDFSRT